MLCQNLIAVSENIHLIQASDGQLRSVMVNRGQGWSIKASGGERIGVCLG
jgi:hypothetical protein